MISSLNTRHKPRMTSRLEVMVRMRFPIYTYDYTTTPDIDLTIEQERYFNEVKKWEDLHPGLKREHGVDAWRRVFDRMTSLFPEWDVEVAVEKNGQKYFSGIFRAPNDSIRIHCDFSPYDSLTEDWIINTVECQIVYNLYLAPIKAGRTVS